MPELSRFFGIIIYMYGHDHNPPHFHILYGEYEAIMYINTGTVEGDIPPKVTKKVKEWLKLHSQELLNAWDLAQKGESPGKIEPL
ncbi:MAG: DUF4160 domain-containing protein [Cyclobacteriaceae bacterium]